MGNPFSTISDTLSDFAGDVADAWNKPDIKTSGESKYLSYPNSLGNSSDDTLDYNSDGDVRKYADARAKDGGSDSVEPFIMFEMFRVTELDYNELNDITNKIKKLTTIGVTSGNGATPESIENERNTLIKRREVLEDQVGKRVLNKTIALYMTSSISVNDSMQYDQESRKLAAFGAEIADAYNAGSGITDSVGKAVSSLKAEDYATASAVASGAIVGGIGATLGNIAPGSLSTLLGGGSGVGLGQVVGDEMLRRMGKSLNPNEYMQYKNTQLRSFSFNWKFLPDSIQESLDCEDIIRAFRGAAHAHRKSTITLTVPDHVVVSFHGVSGMVALPDVVISNVSVTYNPNSASFFKQNNNPVEVDLSVTLSEIMPIYRDDVENKGY